MSLENAVPSIEGLETRRLENSAAKVSLSALEQYLSKAADLLRGAIDQADFKAYIFPLMFFKRISDVYLEEYSLALVESDGDHEFASFAENHRFQIPEGCLWEDVRSRTENIGQLLVGAMREIEKANPDTLYGIFGAAAWTNKSKLPDRTLTDLLEHFSSLTLSNSSVPPDMLGQAYEYLIKRFADQSNKKGGEYYTPRSVVGLMVDILNPRPGETIYDPACGSGGMLLGVVEHLKDSSEGSRSLLGKLYGQEKVMTTSGIARMNLLLHGIEDFFIVKGDTLNSPAFYEGEQLAKFDCVIANPPFSLKNWGEESWSSDPWGRNSLGGTPPKGYADWAWVQHMHASMASETGRIAVVLPQGALFRQGTEGRIRQAFLDSDLIETVIGLAPNLFYGTGLAASILILQASKPESRKGKVLVINGETLFKKGRNQNTLATEHAAQLLEMYEGFTDVEGFAHVATLDEIKSNKYSLNIPLYVAPAAAENTLSLDEAVDQLRAAHDAVQATRTELDGQLAKWGLS